MDSNCESKHCRIKLREYFDLTSKLYDDIGSLEEDIKEKESFVQKLKKGRNDFQHATVVLKKKNAELFKEIDVLVEKNERFETDAGELKKTKSDLKDYKDKLELIEEEFDIDYELAAKVRDTENKLSELMESIDDDSEKNEDISISSSPTSYSKCSERSDSSEEGEISESGEVWL